LSRGKRLSDETTEQTANGTTGLTHAVTLIPGDGIGPEVVDATVQILEATGVSFAWERQEAGAETALRRGTALPDEAASR
jgi:isocitrate/isopropylmalate dehydrogenase